MGDIVLLYSMGVPIALFGGAVFWRFKILAVIAGAFSLVDGAFFAFVLLEPSGDGWRTVSAVYAIAMGIPALFWVLGSMIGFRMLPQK